MDVSHDVVIYESNKSNLMYIKKQDKLNTILPPIEQQTAISTAEWKSLYHSLDCSLMTKSQIHEVISTT